MQTKSVVSHMAAATLLVFALSAAPHAQPSLNQWMLPWTPIGQHALVVHADSREIAGGTIQTLRVTDGTGKQLFSLEGDTLMDVIHLPVGPTGEETLLVAHWSSGQMSDGSTVTKVADLFTAEVYGFLDIDGDGYQEILAFERSQARNRPSSESSLTVVAYRWTGSSLKPVAHVPAVRMQQALATLYGVRAARRTIR